MWRKAGEIKAFLEKFEAGKSEFQMAPDNYVSAAEPSHAVILRI